MNTLPRFAGPAIFVLAVNVLVLEVALTRIFSVITFHHFTYLIIALALLGFGAAGTVLTVHRRFAGTAVNTPLLADCAWLFGLVVMVSFLLITRTGFDAMAIYSRRDFTQLLALLALMVLAAAPFFFGGLCIGYLVSKSGDQINRLYFFDLVGAGFGSLGSLFAINYLGAPSTVFWVALSACVVAILLGGRLDGKIRWRYPLTALVAVMMALLTLVRSDAVPVPFPPSKGVRHTETEHRWHVVARVDVTGPLEDYPDFGGKLSRVYRAQQPPLTLRYVYQDGMAPTGIIKLEGRDPKDMPVFGHYLQGSPYRIRPGGTALVIGPGGGVDVAIALFYGSAHVTAVEINPWTIDYVRDKYNRFAGGLYRRPDVSVIRAEGRHFLTATDRTFDVIQLSGVDTFSALASGAYALTENYLYTREAVSDFLDHLRPGGVLSFSRWLFSPPRETLRLAVTARVALEARGVQNTDRNIMVIVGHRGNDAPWAETLIKLEPFTAEEVSELRRWAESIGFDVIYDPLHPYQEGGAYDSLQKTPRYDPVLCARIFDSGLRTSGEAFANYANDYYYKITPSADDAPFFFNFYKMKSLLKPFAPTLGGYGVTRLPLGLFILVLCLVQIVVLGGLLILLPMRGRSARLRGTAGATHVFVYFACIGLAFIAIEIILLQKLTVFVGGPTYSMAVTLFGLLVFCGTGSFMARRFRGRPRRGGAAVLLALAGCVVVTMWFLNHGLPHLMGLSHPMRCLVGVLALMPIGLLMGAPFPTGIRLAEGLDTDMVPWAWCVNAFATVLGSITAILLAMFVGLTAVAYGAAVVYLVAMAAMRTSPRPN